MGETTRIEWTRSPDGTPGGTWNPWQGCTHVSPGCDNCYAERLAKRTGHDFNVVRRSADATFYAPLRWQKALEKTGKQKRVFPCSIADFFHRGADAWRAEAWEIMGKTPNIIYLVLTKRIDRAEAWYKVNGWLPNVWLGMSVESLAFVSRLDVLARIPAPVRFVSAEPLLGPLDLKPWLGSLCGEPCSCVLGQTLDQVIVGGESGPYARPMHPDWVRRIRDDCQAAGVPFFFKQWGEWVPFDHPSHGTHYEYVGEDKFAMKRVGKTRAGATLDGREWGETPR